MKLKIALLQILPGRSLAEQFMIGKKACEQAKTMGAYIAEIDMDLLRDYREHEVMGGKYRRPGKYGAITED
ncbi:MAG: hypothetical protein LIO41_01305 [Ruminococcus sp.]|nr:hypothetical protein [Ruminococcus sp.]